MRAQIIAIIGLFLCIGEIAMAQQHHEWEMLVSELIDDEEQEGTVWEETFDILCELEEHPLDINTAEREELERIPFLTVQQVEDILEYRYHNGELKSLGELSMIESLDRTRCRLLSYFVTLVSSPRKSFPTLNQLGKYGKHDLLLTGKIPFYKRKGDEDGYLGYPYRHSFRYTFHYSDFVQVGAIGSQDAGEPFLANRNRWGYDHYSLYLLLRKRGRLKTLVTGRYLLKFGAGLVMNTNMSFGKSAAATTLGRSNGIVRGYSSRSNYNYLQGAAATVSLRKGVDLTGFISYRHLDATMNKDDSTVSTIQKTGYHRTKTEMDKKNNVVQTVAGGNLNYFTRGFHVGITGLYTTFDHQLKPVADKTSVSESQRYRLFSPSGKTFWNISADYGYVSRRLTICGETATGDCHAVATLNMLSWMVSPEWSLQILQRFYSYKYYALMGESFHEGSSVQNESGIYMCVNWQPSRKLSLSTYLDYAYFPWARYQTTESSQTLDYQLKMTYSIKKSIFSARYRMKRATSSSTSTHRTRMSWIYDNALFKIKTQADMTLHAGKQQSFGWMLAEECRWRCRKAIQLSANVGYFHTQDYNSRVYSYEQSLPYSFSFPAFYGEGIRYALMARIEKTLPKRLSSVATVLLTMFYLTSAADGRQSPSATVPSLSLILRLGTTNYFDRDKISSGLQEINHSSMTDMDVCLSFKF